MFNGMSAEVRNLLLVASELGGEAAQYVKVLRKEKERLLPVDAIQSEMEELKAQAEQALAAEDSMFKALTKANDRVQVAEKNAASCKGLLEQANADICKARAAEANMLRSLTMANNTTYEAREEARKYKGQLEKQAEELELMQANRVHAEVYQNVAAERDRALAELRTQEQAFQKELNEQHEQLSVCREALVNEQAARAELAKELQGCIADERANLATTRKERDRYGDEVLLLSKELAGVSNKYDQLRVAFNKSGEEVMRLHLERVSMLRENDNAKAVIKSVEIGEAAARKELGEVTAKYEKAQAKLLSIEALVSKPMSDIHTVALKAAGKVQCNHDKTHVVADSVASFIRSPIREVLESS